MKLCLIITVAHTSSALLIAIDNINTVCELGLMTLSRKLTMDFPGLNNNYILLKATINSNLAKESVTSKCQTSAKADGCNIDYLIKHII